MHARNEFYDKFCIRKHQFEKNKDFDILKGVTLNVCLLSRYLGPVVGIMFILSRNIKSINKYFVP